MLLQFLLSSSSSLNLSICNQQSIPRFCQRFCCICANFKANYEDLVLVVGDNRDFLHGNEEHIMRHAVRCSSMRIITNRIHRVCPDGRAHAGLLNCLDPLDTVIVAGWVNMCEEFGMEIFACSRARF